MEEDKENITTTRIHSRKRQRKQQHQTRIGVHDATNELQFYEISVPVEQEENHKKTFQFDVEPGFIEGVYPLCPDMTGDNGRKEYHLNNRQLKELSEFKCQPRRRQEELEEQEKFYPFERFEDLQPRREQVLQLPSVHDISVTKTEEEEILERAELYALTAAPDQRFYILENHDAPLDLTACRDFNKELKFSTNNPGGSGFGASRKRKRRSYNNINCFVSHHNKKDASDNTHMLPEGTRLIKPPNKLVELVAQVLDSSPDGLLQVQHIYTVLQNLYPYFRYMDKSSINSWRSSIRHALYQKWFKKVRFQTDSINSKGCFWAINRKYNPKEWTMPGSEVDDDCGLSLDDDGSLDLDLDLDGEESLAAVASMLAECEPLLENDSDYGSEEQQDFVAHEFDRLLSEGHLGNEGQFTLPTTVKSDPDPVLTSCSPTVEEPKIGLSSPQYLPRMDTPVLSYQDDHGYHMESHCSHDWNMPMWESESCPHYSQLGYTPAPVYCWDYMSPAHPSCTEHMDNIPADGIVYNYPIQPCMEDHCF